MDVRNITPSMKQQLMKMAGITDTQDFDDLVEKMAPAAMAAASSPKSGPSEETPGDDVSAWSLASSVDLTQESKKFNGNKECALYPFQIFFVKILAAIEAAGLEKYSVLDGDMAKQLEYVYSFYEADDDLRNIPSSILSRGENKFSDPRRGGAPSETCLDRAEKSKMLRDRGNKSYSRKEMHAALAFYSQAIVAAPVNSRETALAIGNRSATFFEMGEWKKCLDDMEALFDFYEYPKEMYYKLYDRKGRSLMGAAKSDSQENNKVTIHKAINALKEAIETVKDSKLTNTKQDQFIIETSKIIKSLEDELAKNCSLQGGLHKSESTKDKNKISGGKKNAELAEINEKDNPWICPFKMWERNSAFPVISDACDIVYDDRVGRHVKATRNIMAGEAINIEEAIVSHLSPYKMKTNCVHCFRKTGSSVYPSPLNSKARFCSLYCLRTAMKEYHRVESKADVIDIFYTYSREEDDSSGSGCIPLAYRAVTQKGLQFFLDNRSKLFTQHNIRFCTNVETGFSYTGDEHYRGLFNLVNHLEKMTPNERLSFSIRSVALLKCLKASGFFTSSEDVQEDNKEKEDTKKESLLSENESYIAQLLFHFQTGIQYNLHAIYQIDGALEAGKKIPLLDIGAGVYPTTILFNHSCTPNTLRINQGTRVIFIAKRNIRKGEEIHECYGAHHLSMDLMARQQRLKRGYAFDCACQACVEDYPTMISGKLPYALSTSVAQKLGSSLTRYKKYFEEGKLEKSFEVCREYLNRLDELNVANPHRNYEIATIALCSCLWGMTQTC